MMEVLVRPPIVAVEAFADRSDELVLAGEEDLIAGAVEVRRREFVTARRCAREALEKLGYPVGPIRTGLCREPRWPAGVVGSITHCAGYRAAAICQDMELASLGIDAEPHGPLPDGVLESVVVEGDQTLIACLARADPAICWDRLLFSAKESIYKAWYPLTHRWLGFEDVHLSIDSAAGAFTGHLRVPGRRQDGAAPLTELHGRFLVSDGLVVTAVTVPHQP
jgi:4'-phosphopantetheinyl transferase EntD